MTRNSRPWSVSHVPRRTVACLALSLAVVMLVAACSGGDKQPAGQATAAPAPPGMAAATAVPSAAAAAIATMAAARATTAPAPPAAAALGGGSPAALDACALVTKPEAVAALGEAVDDGKSTPPLSQQMGNLNVTIYHCSYDSPTTVRNVAFDVWRAPSGADGQVRQFVDAVCRQTGKERLPGFGDAACWYDAGHRELSVAKGSSYVNIRVSPAPNADAAEAVKSVARALLGRLP